MAEYCSYTLEGTIGNLWEMYALASPSNAHFETALFTKTGDKLSVVFLKAKPGAVEAINIEVDDSLMPYLSNLNGQVAIHNFTNTMLKIVSGEVPSVKVVYDGHKKVVLTEDSDAFIYSLPGTIFSMLKSAFAVGGRLALTVAGSLATAVLFHYLQLNVDEDIIDDS